MSKKSVIKNMCVKLEEEKMEAIKNNQELNEMVMESNESVVELQEVEKTNDNLEKIKESTLDAFIPSISRAVANKSTRGGGLSIVNAKTGKRVSINKKIMDYLKIEDKIQFAFSDNEIAIGKELPNNKNYFNIKVSKGTGIVYCSELVFEITDLYNLDFSDRTSITFDNIQYQSIQGVNVVIVKVR